jgi:GH24 family phage-related lysozyme (muramidase)
MPEPGSGLEIARATGDRATKGRGTSARAVASRGTTGGRTRVTKRRSAEEKPEKPQIASLDEQIGEINRRLNLVAAGSDDWLALVDAKRMLLEQTVSRTLETLPWSGSRRPPQECPEIISDLLRWEGMINYMYLDTHGYVTVGIGNLVKSEAAAQRLPFVDTVTGAPSRGEQIVEAFRRVSGMPAGMRAREYRSATTLRLPDEVVYSLAASRLQREFLPGVRRAFPHFDQYPSPAQRAIVDMAYNLGVKGISKFKSLRAACEAGDWQLAARESRRSTSRPERNEWTRQLFLQAGRTVIVTE